MEFGRRKFFGLGALGGLAGIATGLGWGRVRGDTAATYAQDPALNNIDFCGDVGKAGIYSAQSLPPLYLAPDALDPVHTPPPFSKSGGKQIREIELKVMAGTREVGRGVSVDTWTYNGTAPGPIIRATLGDSLKITLTNKTKCRHSLHFHGDHDVAQDGWQSVQPEETRLYEIEAGPIGVHPYHCHTPPFASHFSRGMYGTLIVDPPEGRPPAHEFVLCLTGWDINNDGKNEIYAWNGIAGFYDLYPLKVPVGELVRLYIMNFVEFEPVGSFHLHAQSFDVYRSGTSLTPQDHTDVITLGQTERAIVEFRLPRRGRYMFHPHQIWMAEKGAMGWITAI